jgi:hypothetical protein
MSNLPVRSRFVQALGLVAAVVVLSGCQYLFGFPSEPPFPMPSAAGVYDTGHATVVIGTDPAITFDDVSRPGTYDPSFGGEVTFRTGDGWYLQVFGASIGTGGLFGTGAYVQIDRIVDTQHWTTADPTRCVVTVTAADESALRGTATCKGLRWSDALGGFGGGFGAGGPAYIPDQPVFDAEITFEATPTGTRVG